MTFDDLTKSDINLIREVYQKNNSRKEIQTFLAKTFNVERRTIRRWAKKLGIGVLKENVINPAKILIYDIETPRLTAELWWSGKQFVNGNDIIDEPKIISISWKWYGEDIVHAAHWDIETQDDRRMMEEFLDHYNEADIIVGINNNRFDNRWINVRAVKHGLAVNTFPRSIDIQMQCKRYFRMPSYSLKYTCEFFDVPYKKLDHEGIIMWRKIQYGDLEERKEYMKKMIEYNVGDIMATEALFMRLLPVLNLQSHLGVAYGNQPYSCPMCGGVENIELFKTTITPAGTVQHIMVCGEEGHKYKISNRNYLNWLNNR
jgi:DNA polymerase elongation subunit (family B)